MWWKHIVEYIVAIATVYSLISLIVIQKRIRNDKKKTRD